MNMLKKRSSGIITSELILLWGRQVDMVSLRTGPFLPALSPGPLVTTQAARKVHLRGAWTYSMYFFPTLGLCPFGDSWRLSLGGEWCCRGDGGRVHGAGVPVGKWSAEKGKRTDTTCLQNFVHNHISSMPSSYSHTSWRLLGIQRLGGTWAGRTWSSPEDCGERGAVGVFLVVVWCPYQGGTGTN